MSKAVGSKGQVYLTIPENGTGKVTLNINNRLIELDAQAKDSVRIESGVSVHAVDLVGNVVIVKKAT